MMNFCEHRYKHLVTGWTVRSLNPGKGKIFLFSPRRPYELWDLHSLLFIGSFRGLKLPGREVNHLRPSNAKVTNEWSCTSAFLFVCPRSMDRGGLTHYVYRCSFVTLHSKPSKVPWTAQDSRTPVPVCIEADGWIFENLLWTIANLSLLCKIIPI